jgi:hypothetical protein
MYHNSAQRTVYGWCLGGDLRDAPSPRWLCYSPRRKLPYMADLTIDQELDLLDDALRRLKVEYDIYFAGGTKRPPVDNESRVRTQMRRYMENSRLSARQRFRLNNIAQRYTGFTELWRRKGRIKDRGYVRPEDKLLGVGGFGTLDTASSPRRSGGSQELNQAESFVLFSNDVFEAVPLYESLVRARESVGQALGDFDSFAAFVQLKAGSIRQKHRCEAVEYTVKVQDGQVHLKARPRKDLF